ncbi:MAG: thiamine pyrophosphate-binding protein [Alphaproteobacteria bacterium]|nr:thiamine pyrophosphate-binding protein [Alphaproteobacteria bacterium]
MPNLRSGGKILVECLLNQGVNTAFGVPGESYLDVLDALYDVQNQLRMIVTRHESGASFAAEAYGKLTGQPGICFVTRGPGAANAAIGVHTARQNSSPMILFVGQIGRDMRDREAFQEVDYRAFFGSVAKWVTEIDNVARIPELVARAFTVALSGRPGPVVVALPEDMLRDLSDVEACTRSVIARAFPDPAAMERAIAAIAAAKNPLVLVGGGGWSDAGRHDLQRFVDTNNLPAAVVFRSQDLLDHRQPAYIGDAGVGMSPHVKQAIRDADLILALNVRLGESATDGWSLLEVPNMAARLVHIHASDAELGKIYQPDIAIQADPNVAAHVLAKRPVIGDWSGWRDQGRQGFKAMQARASVQGAVDMVAISKWLDQHLEDDAILSNGAGNFAVWPSKFLTFSGKRRLLAPQSGAMGAGFPAAMAAKAVDPTRQVVCFAGDGDFQMSLPELGTAAQERLQPILLLLNNGMYGTIRAHQAREYPGRVSGTKIVNPDYVALAKAYGLAAIRVEKTADFAAAFQMVAASATGGLIELIIDAQDITPFGSLDAIKPAKT